jgi:hypothetical protein
MWNCLKCLRFDSSAEEKTVDKFFCWFLELAGMEETSVTRRLVKKAPNFEKNRPKIEP